MIIERDSPVSSGLDPAVLSDTRDTVLYDSPPVRDSSGPRKDRPTNASSTRSPGVRESSRRFGPGELQRLQTSLQSLRESPSQLQHLRKDVEDMQAYAGSQFSVLAETVATLQDKVARQDAEHGQRIDSLLREKRRLFNQALRSSGNIRVFCRIRAQEGHAARSDDSFDSAVTGGEHAVAECDGNLARVECPSDTGLNARTQSRGGAGPVTQKEFEYDRVFGPEVTQEDVFADVQPLMQSVMDGTKVCIFAYGQTGSGKTYTMEGPAEDHGIVVRSFRELLSIASDLHYTSRFTFDVSIIEIYNEQIQDLLINERTHQDQPEGGRAMQAFSSRPVKGPEKRFEITQTENGVVVTGLRTVRVGSVEEFQKVLAAGQRSRAVGMTSMNEHSSRSHLVLTVTVRSLSVLTDEVQWASTLSLVDMAGSERLSKSESQGQRLSESLAINKSLSALGDVISALTAKKAHVPYRNSKLTHILSESLRGDAKVLMLVTCSPLQTNVQETLSSLRFASRARNVELQPIDREQYSKLSRRIQQQSRAVVEKDEALQQAQQQLVQAQAASLQAASRTAELEAALQATKEQKQKAQQQLLDELEAARAREDASTADARRLQAQVAKLETTTERLRAENAALGERVQTGNALSKQIAELKASVEALRAENADLSKQNAVLIAQNETIQEQNTSFSENAALSGPQSLVKGNAFSTPQSVSGETDPREALRSATKAAPTLPGGPPPERAPASACGPSTPSPPPGESAAMLDRLHTTAQSLGDLEEAAEAREADESQDVFQETLQEPLDDHSRTSVDRGGSRGVPDAQPASGEPATPAPVPSFSPGLPPTHPRSTAEEEDNMHTPLATSLILAQPLPLARASGSSTPASESSYPVPYRPPSLRSESGHSGRSEAMETPVDAKSRAGGGALGLEPVAHLAQPVPPTPARRAASRGTVPPEWGRVFDAFVASAGQGGEGTTDAANDTLLMVVETYRACGANTAVLFALQPHLFPFLDRWDRREANALDSALVAQAYMMYLAEIRKTVDSPAELYPPAQTVAEFLACLEDGPGAGSPGARARSGEPLQVLLEPLGRPRRLAAALRSLLSCACAPDTLALRVSNSQLVALAFDSTNSAVGNIQLAAALSRHTLESARGEVTQWLTARFPFLARARGRAGAHPAAEAILRGWTDGLIWREGGAKCAFQVVLGSYTWGIYRDALESFEVETKAVVGQKAASPDELGALLARLTGLVTQLNTLLDQAARDLQLSAESLAAVQQRGGAVGQSLSRRAASLGRAAEVVRSAAGLRADSLQRGGRHAQQQFHALRNSLRAPARDSDHLHPLLPVDRDLVLRYVEQLRDSFHNMAGSLDDDGDDPAVSILSDASDLNFSINLSDINLSSSLFGQDLHPLAAAPPPEASLPANVAMAEQSLRGSSSGERGERGPPEASAALRPTAAPTTPPAASTTSPAPAEGRPGEASAAPAQRPPRPTVLSSMESLRSSTGSSAPPTGPRRAPGDTVPEPPPDLVVHDAKLVWMPAHFLANPTSPPIHLECARGPKGTACIRSVSRYTGEHPGQAAIMPDLAQVEMVETQAEFKHLTSKLPEEALRAVTSHASVRVTIMRYARLHKLVTSKLSAQFGDHAHGARTPYKMSLDGPN